ncbi:DUF899 family protein [Streptomyces xiamenensis]
MSARPDRPAIVDRATWNDARGVLLQQEKALTRMKDAISAGRRRMPMVEVRPDCTFDGSEGTDPGERIFDAPVDHIAVPNTEGPRAATAHLIARGCRRIAMVTGPDLEETNVSSLRYAGYHEALRAAGLTGCRAARGPAGLRPRGGPVGVGQPHRRLHTAWGGRCLDRERPVP